MVDRGKTKQARSKGLIQRLNKEDMISQLPDPLICQILCHLRTKEAFKTSVLSTRWRTLGLWVPCLDFGSWDFQDFNSFVSFGNSFFDSDRVSRIQKVKLHIEETSDSDRDPSYLKSWIDAAAKRKIQHLDVSLSPDTAYEVPLRLYETLVSLKLYEVEVTLDDAAGFVSLPSLKTMHLEFVRYRNEATFERLVSCCPVLEELNIFAYPWHTTRTVYRVLSRSLKKLRIEIYVEIDERILGFGFMIDAPRLSFLSINDNYSDTFIIKNMDSSAQVDISLPFGLVDFDEASVSSRRSTIRSFLTGISKVRDMTICGHTFKLIRQYSESERLPQFGYMSRLRVTLRVSDLEWLPAFLESCANLKSLVLEWNGNSKKMRFGELNRIVFSSVPECLLSSLEFVDVKTNISGYVPEMKLVRYFLENSAILKKLTLNVNYGSIDYGIFKNLLKIPRRSTNCQVVVI